MRLNCPNCGAQYEVPIDVIPAEGRDVQCSSCGITWFQAHPDHAAEPDLDLDIPAAENEWVPAPEAAEQPAETQADTSTAGVSMSSESLQDTLKEAVRAQMPEEVDKVIAEEVETRIDDSPLGDFEAELDAQLASGEDISWEATPETPTEPEAEFVPEPVLETPAEPEPATAEDPEPVFAPEPEPEPEPEEMAAPVTDSEELFAPAAAESMRGRARRRREVDPAVADILREEANLEAEARRAEEGAIETQQEFGLEASEEDETAKRAGQARARMARMRGLSEEPQISAEPDEDPNGSRRNLLPDIEEINSTLRATEDRAPEELPDGRPSHSQRRRGGNRLGFGFALILIAALMFVYARPGTVTERFPQFAPAVSGYVSSVDDGRIWLDVQMTKLMLWLDGMSSEDASGEA
ncbi:zinc-ribbon domain-containing protein [Cognatishimia sp.]|uniref:zinc-ribbon domain-containing protein n=1 Tax=Cognatishimia sp. TaxID=2211648 RepID=UPI003511CFD5